MPECCEFVFVQTLNSMGYMASSLDAVSKQFIRSCKPQSVVLDIGAAYGVAALEALKNGAHVVANDIDDRHLNILKSRCPSCLVQNLTLAPGCFFGQELFGGNVFDNILMAGCCTFILVKK